MLKAFLLPFVASGGLLVLTAVYLSRFREAKRLARELRQVPVGNMAGYALVALTVWAVLPIPFALWFIWSKEGMDALVATFFVALAFNSYEGILLILGVAIFVLAGSFKILQLGMPVAHAAGRQMNASEREELLQWGIENGKKFWARYQKQ